MMQKYDIHHRLVVTNRKVVMPNAYIVWILEEFILANPNNWTKQLHDENGSYNAHYETPTGSTPLDMIHGMSSMPQFEIGDTMVRFEASFQLTSGKLKSRWTGPYQVFNLFPNNVCAIKCRKTNQTFNVNGNRLKHHFDKIDLSEIIEKTKIIIPTNNN